jgi:hypothetical protein
MLNVYIFSDLSLSDFYSQVLASIDRRFHSYQTTFPVWPVTERELGEIETLTAYAAAIDTSGGPPPGVHLENWTG